MLTGGRQKYYYIGIAVFILILITGLLSGVSWQASVIRAILAAVFFSALSRGVVEFLAMQILSAGQAQPDTGIIADQGTRSGAGEQPAKGRQVDIVLPAEETVFEPLAPQQIDPRLNKVINEDPERIASMVKKMGLEE